MATGPKVINIAIPTTYPGSKAKDKSKETPATTTTTTTTTTKTPSTVVETPETPVATVKPVTTIVKDAFGNKMVSENKKEQQILALKGAKSAPGATFSILLAKQKKVTNDSITISWKKVEGAKSYIVYGSKSGKTDKYVKLKTVTGTSFTQKKLKKGTYYKYVVVAVGNGKALATSKTLYIATKGGMVGNYKTITTGASDNKVNIKVGKTFKLQAAAKAESTKLKVKKFRALTYESSNKAVATVSNKGVIKAVGKGTCDVYVYAQNGVLVKIKVKVK